MSKESTKKKIQNSFKLFQSDILGVNENA